MSLQHNNIHFSNDYENAVMTCTCGCLDHGTISFKTTLPDDEFDEMFFINVGGIPYSKNFWHKIKHAWGLLLGRAIYLDLESSVGEGKQLAEFLTKRVQIAEDHLENFKKNPKSKMTLGQLRHAIAHQYYQPPRNLDLRGIKNAYFSNKIRQFLIDFNYYKAEWIDGELTLYTDMNEPWGVTEMEYGSKTRVDWDQLEDELWSERVENLTVERIK